MRAAILVLLLLAVVRVAEAAPDPVVIAKLVEKPSGLPHCGIFAIRAVVRFEVQRVVSGTFREREVYAIVLCPELHTLGSVHKLELGAPMPANQYIDTLKPGAPRYTALSMTVSPP